METKKLSELKPSEYFDILAAVSEVIEKGSFKPAVTEMVLKEKSEGKWALAVHHSNISYTQMESIKKALGTSFNIEVKAETKEKLLISIDGQAEDYLKLRENRQKELFAESSENAPLVMK